MYISKDGLTMRGETPARIDLVVELWDVLVSALAIDEINLRAVLSRLGAERRGAEARAAMQVRLKWGK